MGRGLSVSGLVGVVMAAFAAAARADSVPPFEHVSCKGEPNEIRVVIQNVKKNVGQVAADLYWNDPANFLAKEGRVYQVRFAARSPVTQFCLKAPGAGAFAIAVYHDKNANKRFDKNAIGLPAEPYGVSNNPPMRFAAPTVEEALIDVKEDGAATIIRLRG